MSDNREYVTKGIPSDHVTGDDVINVQPGKTNRRDLIINFNTWNFI